jgi:hypothetical protein
MISSQPTEVQCHHQEGDMAGDDVVVTKKSQRRPFQPLSSNTPSKKQSEKSFRNQVRQFFLIFSSWQGKNSRVTKSFFGFAERRIVHGISCRLRDCF